jgi:hypothetical protein
VHLFLNLKERARWDEENARPRAIGLDVPGGEGDQETDGASEIARPKRLHNSRVTQQGQTEPVPRIADRKEVAGRSQ